jgi:putative peptidoglycan lipid II flippase
VLISGAVQVLMLMPSLYATGFQFRLMMNLWTPAVRRMLALTGPVALGAAVLQIGVLMDKGIAIMLAEAPGQTQIHPFGQAVQLPMVEGAAARLDLAQFMYQFPLGVFAIALATAIFPKLAGEAAADTHRAAASDEFRNVLRRGVEASLFIGLPASAGMALVSLPAARLLFQHGQFTAGDAQWVALSTMLYSCAIWAFSLLQIVNRAYYALHDAATPLKWVAVNLLLNLIIELPLIFTPLRESGMAVGTLVSFAIQSIAMLLILNRRAGGIGLKLIAPKILRMLAATVLMTAACLAVMGSPIYPAAQNKLSWAIQLALIMTTGGATYFVACWLMGIDVWAAVGKRKGSVD